MASDPRRKRIDFDYEAFESYIGQLQIIILCRVEYRL